MCALNNVIITPNNVIMFYARAECTTAKRTITILSYAGSGYYPDVIT